MNFENIATKALRKETAALAEPKHRRRQGAFMAEGTKCVLDTLGNFALRRLFATRPWLETHAAESGAVGDDKIYACNRGELGEMSSMTLAPDVIAVYELPETPDFDAETLKGQLVLALDRVQDPGNLGTIMRTADWMGVTTVLASADTVDCFNPKAVQSTMGAISRVSVVYGDLPAMLAELGRSMPVYGTFLGGENIYAARLEESAVIVMGNEGKGISPDVERLVDRRLLIPSFPPDRPTSESLNVATATAIVLSQFRGRILKS